MTELARALPGSESRREGFALPEAAIALTLLSVGLLAVAGLIRAVAWEAELGGTEAEGAMAAQEAIEAALSERLTAPISVADTASVGGRAYLRARTIMPLAPGLTEISIDVSTASAFSPSGRRVIRPYVTRFWRDPPRPRPPSAVLP